jgi:hypothetical protein
MQSTAFELRYMHDRAQESFAPKKLLHALHPAAPVELRDEYRDKCDDKPEYSNETDKVRSRVLAAPIDETLVVKQYQPPK